MWGAYILFDIQKFGKKSKGLPGCGSFRRNCASAKLNKTHENGSKSGLARDVLNYGGCKAMPWKCWFSEET
jgi:hypothetical protein